MNVDRVYVAKIYMKTKEVWNLKKKVLQKEGLFVKNALVYYVPEKSFKQLKYIDLSTKDKYFHTSLSDSIKDGELYLEISCGLTPYRKMIKTDKNKMSKRKILKKFNEYIKEIKEW